MHELMRSDEESFRKSIAENLGYLEEYFNDMNVNSRDVSSGDTLSKAMVLSHMILKEVQGHKKL